MAARYDRVTFPAGDYGPYPSTWEGEWRLASGVGGGAKVFYHWLLFFARYFWQLFKILLCSCIVVTSLLLPLPDVVSPLSARLRSKPFGYHSVLPKTLSCAEVHTNPPFVIPISSANAFSSGEGPPPFPLFGSKPTSVASHNRFAFWIWVTSG